MEIKLKSCSNIHLLKQIHLFISQNNIPIDITTSLKNTNTITGGGSISEVKLAEKAKNLIQTETNIDPAHLIYKPAWTPYSAIYNFVTNILSQKEKDTTNDQQNQNTLNSVLNLNQKQIITDPTIGLETLSKPIQKKTTILPEKISSLFLHIETNHTNPLESIKGTKLYYLMQRTDQCTHLV
jgi:hypothetical protein